jgi:hypothetical protein
LWQKCFARPPHKLGLKAAAGASEKAACYLKLVDRNGLLLVHVPG